MTLKPPFFAQERPDTCMIACLRMILAHHGTETTEAALIEEVSLEDGGLDPDALAHIAKNHGLQAEARRLDLDVVAKLVAAGLFPIVLVDRSFLDGEFAIHAVVPIRFTRQYLTVWTLTEVNGESRDTNSQRQCSA